MADAIKALTKEQEAKLPEYVEKWSKIARITAPTDRPRAERAIKNLYKLAGLGEPVIIHMPCPMTAGIVAALVAAHGKFSSEVSGDNNQRFSDVHRSLRDAIHDNMAHPIETQINSAVHNAVGHNLYAKLGGHTPPDVQTLSNAITHAFDYVAANPSEIRSDGATDLIMNAMKKATGNRTEAFLNEKVLKKAMGPVQEQIDILFKQGILPKDFVYKGKTISDSDKQKLAAIGRSGFGGSLWNAPYAGWNDFFNTEVGITEYTKDKQTTKFDRNFIDLTESCGFYWTMKGLVIMSDRPLEINKDNENRLHGETGMSISYRSGYGLFHWHGTEVPGGWIVDKKKFLSADKALKEQNQELRRAACEILGWATILRDLKARTIDKDGDPKIGELVEVNLPGLSQPAKFLRVECGTGREFAVGIPPEVNTALDAQAWIAGKDRKSFKLPEVRA